MKQRRLLTQTGVVKNVIEARQWTGRTGWDDSLMALPRGVQRRVVAEANHQGRRADCTVSSVDINDAGLYVRAVAVSGVDRAAGERLSREVIVEAYLRIVEAQGNDGVNMRRLGRELGVDATAVYRYFRDKDEILAMAAARLLREVTGEVPETGGWRERLRALLLSLRRVYFAHPNALLALQLVAPMLDEGYENVDLALALLRESGLPEEEIPVAFEALETYTIGGTVFDARATPESLERWRRVYSGMPADRFPSLASTGRRLYADVDQAFRYGLDLLLDAIEARAHAKRMDGR